MKAFSTQSSPMVWLTPTSGANSTPLAAAMAALGAARSGVVRSLSRPLHSGSTTIASSTRSRSVSVTTRR